MLQSAAAFAVLQHRRAQVTELGCAALDLGVDARGVERHAAGVRDCHHFQHGARTRARPWSCANSAPTVSPVIAVPALKAAFHASLSQSMTAMCLDT